MILEQALMNQNYIVTNIHAQGEVLKHLHNLGFNEKAKVSIVTKNKENAIVLLQKTRIAIDRTILRLIEVEAMKEDEENWVSLSNIKVGNLVRVISIHGMGAVKRRLLDMGITRGTSIFVRKVAPLGDPIEIHIRGYELTLRKSEAELILVTPIETQED